VSKAARETRKRPVDNLEIIPSSSTQKSTNKDDDQEEKPPVKKEKDDNVLSLKVQRKLELKQKKLVSISFAIKHFSIIIYPI
jgi:hypothetical protein